MTKKYKQFTLRNSLRDPLLCDGGYVINGGWNLSDFKHAKDAPVLWEGDELPHPGSGYQDNIDAIREIVQTSAQKGTT